MKKKQTLALTFHKIMHAAVGKLHEIACPLLKRAQLFSDKCWLQPNSQALMFSREH